MPEQVKLSVERREILGKRVRRLRRQGILPGNIFGHQRESVPIQLNAQEFSRFLKTHAPTTLLSLKLGRSAAQTAVVAHVQHDPVTSAIQHVDFMHVELSKPMKARIPIRLVGQSSAVKNLNGVALQLLETLEVEALPASLPEAITLDISDMTGLNDMHYARDLPVPPDVQVLTDPDEPVMKIEPPTVAVEEAPLVAAEEEEPTAEAGTEG